MEGKIERVLDQKRFGFIKPEDGSKDVFFHFRDLPHGEKVQEGDSVEFEIREEPGGRRSATNIKILARKKETASAKKEEKPPKSPDLQVVEPLRPDEDGDFLVPIGTFRDGKPARRSFRLHSPIVLNLQYLGNEQPEKPHRIFQIDTEQPSGNIAFFVNFEPAVTQVTLTLILDDGQKFIVDLVR